MRKDILKGAMFSAVAGLIIGVLLTTCAPRDVHGQTTGGPTIGEKVTVYGFCLGEEAARTLTQAVATYGIVGYNSVMDDKAIKCFDARKHVNGHQMSFDVELVKPKWTVRLPGGSLYQFWRARDGSTENGFVWVRVWEVPA